MPPGPGVGEEEEELIRGIDRGVDSGSCCSPSPARDGEGVEGCGGE